MKRSKNSNGNMCLPHRRSSACDDNSAPVASALKAVTMGQSLVRQLCAVVRPALETDERSEVVAQMLQSILDYSATAVAALKLCQLDARADDAPVVDDKKRVRNFSNASSKEDGNAKPRRHCKRRRLADDCVTLETPVPHYDGHQWRKYGQKLINNAKHPRSYFRCTYGQEQDCKATKTVQQQQQQDNSANDLTMYAVVYYGQHTCKPGNTDAVVVETESAGQSSSRHQHARSDSQSSNISVTCTSVVVDHQQTASTSLESKLLDMEDSTIEVNKYELFDMGSYAPLDWDSSWEMDPHYGHDLAKFGEW